MNTGEERIVYISVMAAEDRPLYHICPGAPLVRILLPGGPLRCKECWWDEYVVENAIVTRPYPGAESVAGRARILRAPLALFDGGEPLEHKWVLREAMTLKNKGLHTAVKTTGLVDPETLGEAVKVFDAMIFEYLPPIKPELLARKRLAENLELVAEKARVLEIHFFFDGSKRSVLAAEEIAQRYGGRVALHVVPVKEGLEVEDKAYRLVSRLRRKRLNAYLYGDNSFVTSDSLCPECGAVLVSRKPWGVEVRGEVRDGLRGGGLACPSCGAVHEWIIACKEPIKHNVHRELVIY